MKEDEQKHLKMLREQLVREVRENKLQYILFNLKKWLDDNICIFGCFILEAKKASTITNWLV
jgi:hypothetical protein